MDGLLGQEFDSPHLHIVVLFLLQLHITGRHFFYSLQSCKELSFRETFKGTERYFNVPSGVSEYMPLSIIFIQQACLIKDKYGNVKLNKRGEILAL